MKTGTKVKEFKLRVDVLTDGSLDVRAEMWDQDNGGWIEISDREALRDITCALGEDRFDLLDD